ncbi:MAG: riboflavin synthase [Bauldia sp.]|uniref:riboflavin synthase n=1 Tax=Bauldia sp. TaxID=2575872 RepID=UPI001DDB4F80|nr:riboflavin synthase [Bauldia sp.]MCB1497286.1 riboflavin synthase [Bauldia sp.]
MFTGIVSDIGTVIGNGQRNDVQRIAIACKFKPEDLVIGGSMACSGICLTVVSCDSGDDGDTVFEVDAAPETLEVTTASDWDIGRRVNLERPLKVGDELSGHLVSGHVDAVVSVVEREDLGETTRFWFDMPEKIGRLVAPKGSVALDGTSLTVNSVKEDRFDCLLIPHTLQVTNWNERKKGDRINLEVDLIARYVARLAETA